MVETLYWDVLIANKECERIGACFSYLFGLDSRALVLEWKVFYSVS